MPGTTYTLGLDSAPGIAGLNAFKGALGTVTGALALVGVSFGAFKGAEAFTDALKGVWEQGKELSSLHSITGQSISDVIALRKAYSEAGLSADEVSGDLTRLQKSLGGVNEEGLPTGGIFKQLGLNINALKGQSAIQQLEQITGAVGRLGDQSSKTFAISQIFGREGGHVLALDSSSLEEARGAMAGLGAIMQRDAPLFKAIANDLESLKGKVRGFFTGFADTLSPVLLPLLDKLKASINLTGFGQNIGAEVAQAAQVIYGLFQNGNLGEAAGLALRVGWTDATNWLIEKTDEIFDAWDARGPDLLSGIKNAFAYVKDLFLGLADIISGSIQKGIAGSLKGVSILGKEVMPGADYAIQKGDISQFEGSKKIQFALDQMAKGGPLAGGAGFLKGLTTDTAAARQRLRELTDNAKLAAAGLVAVAKPEFFGPPAPGLNLQALAPDKIQPLTDRLAKIGGFIGGNGGVLGERAAQDTARNTAQIAASTQESTKHLGKIAQEVSIPRAAVF